MDSHIIVLITTRINEAKTCLSQSPVLPHDYETLKVKAIHQELLDETTMLDAALSADPDSFHEYFKARCAARFLQNSDSCFSFMAYSNGRCNQMYFDIAMLLVQPRSLGELLPILMPELERVIVVENTIVGSMFNASSEYSAICFSEKPVSSLSQIAGIDELSHFIGVGSMLFDVRQIAAFSFDQLSRFYSLFSDRYPDLSRSVYQHNMDFKRLEQQLLIARNEGQPPLKALSKLIIDLCMINADPVIARDAVNEFFYYFEKLPETLRAGLNALTNAAGEPVIVNLRQSADLEIAVSDLGALIENPAYQIILGQKPTFSEYELHVLSNPAAASTSLTTNSSNANLPLPDYYITGLCSQLQLKLVTDYLSILRSVPIRLYSQLFREVQIEKEWDTCLPYKFAVLIKVAPLPQDRVLAFYQALVDNIERFGGLHELLYFAAFSGPVLMQMLLDTIPPEQRLPTLISQDHETKLTTFHRAASNFILPVDPESFRYLLGLVPSDERLGILLLNSRSKVSVLHQAAKSAQSIDIIFDLLPPEHHLAALEYQDKKGHSLLYFSASNARQLAKLLQLYSDDSSRNTAVRREFKDGSTLLHRAAQRMLQNGPADLDAFKMILAFYAPEEQCDALLKRDNKGSDVLLQAFHSLHIAVFILGLFPPGNRLEMLLSRCSDFDHSNLLQEAARSNVISDFLELLPASDIPVAIQHRSKNNRNLFHFVYHHPDGFRTMWNLTPENERVDALLEKDNNGRLAFHDVLSCSNTLKILFELLPDRNEQRRLLASKTQHGVTSLQSAARNTESLEMVLNCYEQEELLMLCIEKDEIGRNVFHHAVRNAASLQQLLLLVSDPKELICLLLAEDRGGDNVFDVAVRYEESMNVIISRLRCFEIRPVLNEIRKEKSEFSLKLRLVAMSSPVFASFLLRELSDENTSTDQQPLIPSPSP